MTEDIRDLRSFYPFFPNAGASATGGNSALQQDLKAIKDVRVYIEQPVMRETAVNTLLLRLDLTAVASGSLTFTPVYAGSSGAAIQVAVYGVDACPTANSYAIADTLTAASGISGVSLLPTCVVLAQPVCTLAVGSADVSDTLEVEDGYNISVSGGATYLQLQAQPRYGKGLYPSNPYSTDTSVITKGGLRSINGATGAVQISESQTVGISISRSTASAATLDMTISVRGQE